VTTVLTCNLLLHTFDSNTCDGRHRRACCLAYRVCELSHVENWTPAQTLRAAKLLCIFCTKSINGRK